MFSIKAHNHFTGRYMSDGNTLADNYRFERSSVLEMLETIQIEFRLYYIEKILDKRVKNFKSLHPEKFKLLHNKSIFSIEQQNFYSVDNDEIFLEASFIEFLKILQEQYKEVEILLFGETKWLKSYGLFKELYLLLFKYDIINCKYADFKNFFSLKNELSFSTNLFETCSLIYELNKNYYITENTMNTMINMGIINANNKKSHNFQVIDRDCFNSQKKKINDSYASNSIGKEMRIIFELLKIEME